ncbi:glycine N-acyltransferase-like protein 3 isoform X2 [Andrena cerasifolii]
MECPEAMDRGWNFRLLAEEELSQLLDFLAGYLPESLKFHQTLLTYTRDRVWDFNFYVADDWPRDAICLHFPGMTLSPQGLLYESVGVFCPNDRLELLKLLREEDILIDWSKPLYINFVHYDIAEELTRLYEGTGSIERVVGDVFACQNPESVAALVETDADADPDVQVLPLKAEHAENIHELYPANDMECHEVFLRLIRSLPAAGVFFKGNLAAWMVQSYYGAMFSMQTKPEYRRKGYGTKLARYLTRRVAERGYQPFVVIRPENEASQSLYKKLGFRKLYQTVRMTFIPSAWRGAENETSHVLRDNLENAVRQLTIEQNVVDDFRNVDGIVASEEAAQDSTSQVVDVETAVEEPEGDLEECEDLREDVLLEPVAEESEDRIQVNELSVEGTVETRGDAEGTANDDGGDEGDGGTAGGDAE